MKKICLIIHSLGIGGMERVMAELATRFSELENTEVNLVLIGIKREVLYDIPESVVVHRPPFIFNNSRRAIDTIRTIFFLRREVRKIDPDTVLSFGEMWNNLVLLSLAGLPFPVFVSDRSMPDKDLGRFHNFLKNRLYPRAAGYIAQTGIAAEVCAQKGWNRNVSVIGNPIRKIEPGNESEKENIILSVGRLIPTKHFDRLITIFGDIASPGWKLVIVGGDSLKMSLLAELRHHVEEKKLGESVLLTGEQRNVDPYYRKSKIFAYTSSSEGFPNVLGEALSAGLPVVAYNCIAGPSDLIDDQINGFLVETGDEKTFKKQLQTLMTDKDLREKMGSKAELKAAKFESCCIANQYYDFIMGSHEHE